jgi:peptidoglycan/LPS O-acetylase OafA/YrhL
MRVCLDDILDPKRNNFALVRLIAALAVVVSHNGYQLTGNPNDELLEPQSVYSLGDHAVNVFFVVSGILVSASLVRAHSLLEFALARILRIFPALVACTLVLAFCLGPLVSTVPVQTYFSGGSVWRFVLLNASALSTTAPLPGVFMDLPVAATVNGPIWTLKYEIACYIALAGLAAFGIWQRRVPFAVLIGLSCAAAAGLLIAEGGQPSSLGDNMLRFWICFSIGMVLFRARARVPVSVLPLVALGLLWWSVANTSVECVVSPFATGYAAIWFAGLPMQHLRRLTNRTDLSYGIYIIGWPVTQTLIWASPGIDVAVLQVFSLLITIPLAAVSWFAVEKPALASRNYWNTMAKSWFPRFSLPR